MTELCCLSSFWFILFYLIINCFADDGQLRSLILWLEDQKIRHYKIEDRAGLRSVDSNEQWTAALQEVSMFSFI